LGATSTSEALSRRPIDRMDGLAVEIAGAVRGIVDANRTADARQRRPVETSDRACRLESRTEDGLFCDIQQKNRRQTLPAQKRQGLIEGTGLERVPRHRWPLRVVLHATAVSNGQDGGSSGQMLRRELPGFDEMAFESNE